MAKKRVHELAKQYNMPTSEVLKRLNASGLEVKAAATAVDEKLADAALPGSRYCGLDAHQALANRDTDHVGA